MAYVNKNPQAWTRKTDHHFFKGKCKWTRTGSPDKYGYWSTVLYPDNESYERILKLKEEGLMNVIGKDEDGYHITFRRPQNKTYNGKVVGFAPPEVLQADGKTPLRDMLVGNGSDITVKVEVYGFKKPNGGTGKAARLASIRVDNLVPFELKRDFEPGGDQAGMTRGMEEQPKPLF